MSEDKRIIEVHLEDIIPNPFQPRLSFNEDKIQELAESIKMHGIIQPLVLRQNGEKYEIIAGERRFKAATIAGLSTVPAIINNMDNNKSAEVALVENLQRKDLTAIETAKSYEKLQQRGYSQEDIAKKMGVSQPAIANKLRLLNLTEDVQNALLEERISERHARTLLSVADPQKQRDLLNRVINERMTVRKLEETIRSEISSNNASTIIEPKIENFDLDSPFAEAPVSTPSSPFEPKPIEEFSIPTSYDSSFEPLKPLSNEPVPILETLQPGNPTSSSFDTPAFQTFNHLNISDEEVNPFAKTDFKFPEPSFVTAEKAEEKEKTVVNNEVFNISKEDFSTVVKSFEKIKEEIEKAGLRIDMETFNFDEYYQLIIKVHKSS